MLPDFDVAEVVLRVDLEVVPVVFPLDEEEEPVEPLLAEPDILPVEPVPLEEVDEPPEFEELPVVEPLMPDDELPLFWD